MCATRLRNGTSFGTPGGKITSGELRGESESRKKYKTESDTVLKNADHGLVVRSTVLWDI